MLKPLFRSRSMALLRHGSFGHTETGLSCPLDKPMINAVLTLCNPYLWRMLGWLALREAG